MKRGCAGVRREKIQREVATALRERAPNRATPTAYALAATASSSAFLFYACIFLSDIEKFVATARRDGWEASFLAR